MFGFEFVPNLGFEMGEFVMRDDLWPSVSNYVLKVSSDDDSESPLAFLYFLDSGWRSYPEVILSAQVEWFKNKSKKINPDSSKSYNDVAQWFMILKPCIDSINKEKAAPQEAEKGMMNSGVLLSRRASLILSRLCLWVTTTGSTGFVLTRNYG